LEKGRKEAAGDEAGQCQLPFSCRPRRGGLEAARIRKSKEKLLAACARSPALFRGTGPFAATKPKAAVNALLNRAPKDAARDKQNIVI